MFDHSYNTETLAINIIHMHAHTCMLTFTHTDIFHTQGAFTTVCLRVHGKTSHPRTTHRLFTDCLIHIAQKNGKHYLKTIRSNLIGWLHAILCTSFHQFQIYWPTSKTFIVLKLGFVQTLYTDIFFWAFFFLVFKDYNQCSHLSRKFFVNLKKR